MKELLRGTTLSLSIAKRFAYATMLITLIKVGAKSSSVDLKILKCEKQWTDPIRVSVCFNAIQPKIFRYEGNNSHTFDLRHQAKAAPSLPLFNAFMLMVLQIDCAANDKNT